MLVLLQIALFCVLDITAPQEQIIQYLAFSRLRNINEKDTVTIHIVINTGTIE